MTALSAGGREGLACRLANPLSRWGVTMEKSSASAADSSARKNPKEPAKVGVIAK
ncbi:MAG TPA: hypothetical protein VF798_17890 [Burkholderiaceae bacterium]